MQRDGGALTMRGDVLTPGLPDYWPVIDGCLKNPRLWRERRQRPSWMPRHIPSDHLPRFWHREPGLWLPLSCAIAHDNAAYGGFTGASSLTFSFTVGAGSNRLICVYVNANTSDDVSGATFNSVATTLINKGAFTANRWTYLFYLLNPDSGAHNVVVSGVAGYISAVVSSYTGVLQSDQPDAQATKMNSSGAITSMTTTLTTVADNCWTVLGGRWAVGNIAAGAGTTQRAEDNDFNSFGIFDSNGAITPAGSASLIITGTSDERVNSCMASFKPAGAAESGIGAKLIFRNRDYV